MDVFRFDLATVLGRTPAFDPAAPLLTALREEPRLHGVKLIAEPWDIGGGGYQLGRFARRFAASSDIFQHPPRLPYASVNKLTTHDGFTLRDLVSFNHKHNHANGEDNRDGTDSNFSNNHGTEGLEADEATLARRAASQSALLTKLLLSLGTPMLLAGDEQGHSQQGNNNAYCQDNDLTWLNWETADNALSAFTAGLIRLRRATPALQQDACWQDGDGRVQWLNERAQPLTPSAWEQGERRLQIVLSSDWLLLINASASPCEMSLPAGDWLVSPPFEASKALRGGLWQGNAQSVCVCTRRSKE